MATLAIDAQDDAQAAAAWLRAKGGRSPHTFDAYRREATRLLLWTAEQRITLADLKVDDVHRFWAHLSSPPAHWLRPRKPRRGEMLAATQVLAGPLSARSIRYSRTVLAQLCAYLRDAGYLRHNAFALSAVPAVVHEAEPTRLLDQDAWQYLWRWVCALESGHAGEDSAGSADSGSATGSRGRPAPQVWQARRARWLLALLYHTGLRREEVAHARMGDFVRSNRAWRLRVVGKGAKERLVTVNSALLAELVRWRAALGLPDYPTPGEAAPLIASTQAARAGRPLTPRSIGLLVSAIAAQAAAACPDEHARDAIERMSTHWLRHTNATHRLLAGASLETTQDELGHADPRTTRIYARTSDVRRLEDAERLAALAFQVARDG